MKINTRHRNTTTIFDVSGNIDFESSSELRQSLLREIIESHTPCVLVNLSQASHIDDSGVATLVEGLKASRDLGSRFILCGLNASAREVLRISHLTKVFEIYDNEEEVFGAQVVVGPS